MRAVRIASLLLALVAGAAMLPGEARALDPPSASCNGGGCGGWFKSTVTVSWSCNGSGVTGTSGCGAATIGDDTDGQHVHLHRELRRVVRREQRHREEGLVAARRDCIGVTRSRYERVVHEPRLVQLHR